MSAPLDEVRTIAEADELFGDPETNGHRPPPVSSEEALPSFVPMADVVEDEQLSWCVDELMLAREPMIIAATGGSLKTTTSLAIAAGVATGRPVFSHYPVPAAMPVCFVSGEDPASILRNRTEALCRGHGYPVHEALENTHVLALSGLDLSEPRWLHHLARELRAREAGLLILDPIADLDSGEENSNDDRRKLVRALRYLRGETDLTIVVLHHFRKATEGAAKADLLRGGNALPNASRQTFVLEKGEDGSVVVENIKFSRAQRRPSFVLRPTIETDPRNEARWTVARFDYAPLHLAKLDTAQRFVLAQLDGGVRMSTTDLKDAAKGTGVSGADIARALRVLEMRRMLDFEPGPKGSKLWGVLVAQNSGQAGQPEIVLARQAESLPGNPKNGRSACPPPFRGASRTPSLGMAGQPDDPDRGEAWEAA